ncbi:MAG: glycosyltransferase, partial [Aliifodinibius sp.]|nr:glycosyltransferase family 4 protein [candidate division KSB1 bacterium]NIS45103.1 glycosyltransferase family 4 protein [candidate division Zixibacteria bacterium]NIT55864.1 glycosyltransferase family 4 protein [Fodinibius sp.]NIV05261.1 glycosyltransferase [candidate division Zixibacteria bacterium]NIY24448.1 glycosyltransferase [Fodinibius sp.]
MIFQNPEDRDFFIQMGWTKPSRLRLIRGSGVDVNHFSHQPVQEESEIPKVLLPARMLWTKGVGEFVDAGRRLRQQGVEVRFILVGDTDPGNPDAVTEKQLRAWQDQGLVEFWGWQADMRSVYSQATIVCLPSYREGVPKTLLEAA